MSRLSDEQLLEIYWKPHSTVEADSPLIRGLRAVADAAVQAERDGQEPVAYDTGNELWWAKSPDMNDWIRKNGTPLYVFPPAAPVPEGWEPIETAPKDGTSILIFYKGQAIEASWGVVETASWEEGGSEYCWWQSDLNHLDDGSEPTHWMPLPAAPLAASQPEVKS